MEDRYMAPEVFKHRKYDKKVDVFSFAMILYEVHLFFSSAVHWPFRMGLTFFSSTSNYCCSTICRCLKEILLCQTMNLMKLQSMLQKAIVQHFVRKGTFRNWKSKYKYIQSTLSSPHYLSVSVNFTISWISHPLPVSLWPCILLQFNSDCTPTFRMVQIDGWMLVCWHGAEAFFYRYSQEAWENQGGGFTWSSLAHLPTVI